MLQEAPSSYYEAKSRQPSARAVRDEQMLPVVQQLWQDNYRVYGARKIWKAAQRTGHDIGRDQVARLMRTAGIEGVRRTKRVRTTRPEAGAPRHPDLVGRDFTATGPNQLWVTDLTYVPTWAGIAYVCFIIDACSRMIVGWRVASHMRTTMVLDAIEMARWSRGTTLVGLRCHSDAESVNGLYKTELIKPRRPWKGSDDLEIATAEWVDWFNHRRLLEPIGNIPPAEAEDQYYAAADNIDMAA